MIIKYIPKNKEEWTGHLMVEVLKPLERSKLIRALNFKVIDGKVDVDSGEAIDLSDKLFEIGVKHIKSCDLVHCPTEGEHKDIELLQYSVNGTVLIQEVASMVINGYELGNALKS